MTHDQLKDEAIQVLQELVDLKDGPRDEFYLREKPLAWTRALRALEALRAHERQRVPARLPLPHKMGYTMAEHVQLAERHAQFAYERAVEEKQISFWSAAKIGRAQSLLISLLSSGKVKI